MGETSRALLPTRGEPVMSERIPVVPDVIAWARKSSGLEVSKAAKKLGVTAGTVEKWEAGTLQPTVKQLRKAAKVYGRPLAVLLLPHAPTDFQPLSDFRSSRDGAPAEWSPELRTEIRRALSQREVYLEIAEVSPASLPAVVTLPPLKRNQTVEEAAGELRTWLDLEQLSVGVFSRPRELLNAAIARVEQRGVIVIQTQGILPNEMKGFSLAEFPYPVVALNGKDWPRPRLFTLLHEVVHLASRLGGVCDLHEDRRPNSSPDEVEHYCNEVAAAILMPRGRLLNMNAVTAANKTHQWSLEELEFLSRPFASSSEAMLLRLISIGKADWETYRLRKSELEQLYEEARQQERERQQATQGGPSYYIVKARDLGHGYVSSVLDAYQGRAISSLDAADYLEVRYDQLPKLEQAVR